MDVMFLRYVQNSGWVIFLVPKTKGLTDCIMLLGLHEFFFTEKQEKHGVAS